MYVRTGLLMCDVNAHKLPHPHYRFEGRKLMFFFKNALLLVLPPKPFCAYAT